MRDACNVPRSPPLPFREPMATSSVSVKTSASPLQLLLMLNVLLPDGSHRDSSCTHGEESGGWKQVISRLLKSRLGRNLLGIHLLPHTRCHETVIHHL
uniref:Secreted protein n=1 Tax=Echinococcus granulosus TaxID=6210 RepID=A0A068X530_ECHGR|nr:hypothetical protein EgrG_000299300 [Echinococcus granulosus]